MCEQSYSIWNDITRNDMFSVRLCELTETQHLYMLLDFFGVKLVRFVQISTNESC